MDNHLLPPYLAPPERKNGSFLSLSTSTHNNYTYIVNARRMRKFFLNIFLHTRERGGHTHLKVDSGVVIRVNGLAEVDGVAQLLLKDWLAGVARNLEQEEAGIGLRQVVVWRLVLVQHLRGEEQAIQ